MPARVAGAHPWNFQRTCRGVRSFRQVTRTDGRLADGRPVNSTDVGCDNTLVGRGNMKRLVIVGVGATQLSLLEGLAAGHVRPVDPVLISTASTYVHDG